MQTRIEAVRLAIEASKGGGDVIDLAQRIYAFLSTQDD